MRPTSSLLLAAALALPSGAFAARAAETDYPEHDRITKTVELAAGARIEVSRIAGPVEIETTNGRRAEVEIVRSAPTRADLDCGAVVIESSPAKLEIRSEAKCDNVRGSQHVKLSVPRDADITLENIAGAVRIGPTDGMLRLVSIAGHVEARGLREAKMSSLAGGLELSVPAVGKRGIRVSSVTGKIDLGVAGGANAGLVVRNLAGRIHGESPGLRFVDDGDTGRHAAHGDDGAEIVLESIVGAVTIHS